MLRIIDQLEGSSYGKVIKTKEGRESYYEIDKSFIKAPFMKFSAENLGNLAICRDLCRLWLPRQTWKKLEAALNQATALAEGQIEQYSQPIAQARFKGWIDYSNFHEQFEAMVEAIRHEKICRVAYKKPDGERKTYDFAPLELFIYHDSFYFIGWLVDSDFMPYHPNPMTILLHRIEKVETLNNSSKNFPKLPKETWDTFGLMQDETFQVEILFDAETGARVAERKWSADQAITWRDDGKMLLKMTVSSYYEILSWVLSYGSQAEILSPDWLRKDVADEFEKLIKIYNSTE
jgi:predicted DNA-binding transcriptional regulator YafY